MIPGSNPPDPSRLFAALGEDGITRLVAAFYAQVPHDDVLGPMYPKADLAGAERRLRDFLLYRCGGPPRYIEERGHPRLRMRHAPFAIDQRARDRWMQLMTQAMDQERLAGADRELLLAFLDGVATFLMNR
jgi:hemoglobin